MNWDALDAAAEQVDADKSKSGGGDNKYLLVDDWSIKDPIDFRVLPNLPGQDLYFLRVTRFKINKKRFYSKSLLGEECIAQQMHDYYTGLAKDDEDIKALRDAFRNYQKELIYMVPVLMFPDAASNDFTPLDEMGKVICFKAKNFDHLHKVVIDAKYRKNSPVQGIIARDKGRNLSISNGGANILPDPGSLDLTDANFGDYFDTFYPGGDKYPDMLRFVKSQMKSDEHIQSVFEEYFEGGTVIEDDGSTKKHYLGLDNAPEEAAAPAPKASVKPKPVANKPAKPTVGKAKPKPAVDTGDDENPILAMMGGENDVD
jgi:hypothetical protein